MSVYCDYERTNVIIFHELWCDFGCCMMLHVCWSWCNSLEMPLWGYSIKCPYHLILGGTMEKTSWFHLSYVSFQLSEVFEQEINSVMQSLGYCCGIKHSFSPQVLCCYGKQLCTIPRESVYYSYQNRWVLHFQIRSLRIMNHLQNDDQ